MSGYRPSLRTMAYLGMCSTSGRIDEAKERRDPVALADARTSMCDYRVALSLAIGKDCDRNGYFKMSGADQ